jgi:hypothetical protein
MGSEAIKALARAKDRLFPDIQGRINAARALLNELARVAEGLQMSVLRTRPDSVLVSCCNRSVRIDFSDGRLFEVTGLNVETLIVVVEYEPETQAFVAVGKDPHWDAVDALAEYVAARLTA